MREILLPRGEAEDWLVRTRPAAYDLSHAELRATLSALADETESR